MIDYKPPTCGNFLSNNSQISCDNVQWLSWMWLCYKQKKKTFVYESQINQKLLISFPTKYEKRPSEHIHRRFSFEQVPLCDIQRFCQAWDFPHQHNPYLAILGMILNYTNQAILLKNYMTFTPWNLPKL